MTQLPHEWKWLYNEPGPKILTQEAIKHYGIMEHKGKGSFANFDKWAKELSVGDVMTDDDVPWCGLFIGICAQRTGWEVPDQCYRARNWMSWGKPIAIPELGCVLIFKRPEGHHVGLYVGETETHYAVYGGNQSNMVSIVFIRKDRLIGARECDWKISKPENIRRLFVDINGALISNNEA